jgi:hypothetical protein
MSYYSIFTGKKVDRWRLVVEKALGKPIPKGAQIHHLNGNNLNDSPDN